MGGALRRAHDCAWCGAAFTGSTPRRNGYALCGHCGVGTTDPWPTREELADAYSNWYRPAEGRFSGIGDRVLRFTRGTLARRVDEIAPPGRVLDVGAGDGALVDALRARGRDAIGLDPYSPRDDFIPKDITELDGTWAAVVFWHSLEHLQAPTTALRAARGLLVPRGLIAIALPNSQSLQARMFGARWLALDLPRHLVHVPAATLVRDLRSLGFRIERTSYLRGGQVLFGWLHGFVGWIMPRTDLYDAIRRPGARSRPSSRVSRMLALIVAFLIAPLAVAATVVEIVTRRGGSVYVEARAEGLAGYEAPIPRIGSP